MVFKNYVKKEKKKLIFYTDDAKIDKMIYKFILD